MESDNKFLVLLCNDLKKEGGICKLEHIISLNSNLKKYLKDRKLLSFIQGKNIYYLLINILTYYIDIYYIEYFLFVNQQFNLLY
jgi:hypothetical protein